MSPNLSIVLARELPSMASLLKRQAGAQPLTASVIEAFADILEGIGCTEAEFLACKRHILRTEEWFPAPANFVTIIMQAREEARERQTAFEWKNMVSALDAEGNVRLCFKGRVHNGRILPAGWKPDGAPEGWQPNGLPHVEQRALEARDISKMSLG